MLSAITAALFAIAPAWGSGPASPGPAPGGGLSGSSFASPAFRWPVVGPVIRPFEAPANPYAPGHRGIDIAAPLGSEVLAAADGVVAFAGWAGSGLSVSIDHDGGLRTTYSWLSEVDVHKGDSVLAGDPIALSGHGHPDVETPHLHFGVKIGDEYVDPLLYLGGADLTEVIHLAPLA